MNKTNIGRMVRICSLQLTPGGWHFGAKTCTSLYMSCVLYHEVHLMDNTLIRTQMV